MRIQSVYFFDPESKYNVNATTIGTQGNSLFIVKDDGGSSTSSLRASTPFIVGCNDELKNALNLISWFNEQDLSNMRYASFGYPLDVNASSNHVIIAVPLT